MSILLKYLLSTAALRSPPDSHGSKGAGDGNTDDQGGAGGGEGAGGEGDQGGTGGDSPDDNAGDGAGDGAGGAAAADAKGKEGGDEKGKKSEDGRKTPWFEKRIGQAEHARREAQRLRDEAAKEAADAKAEAEALRRRLKDEGIDDADSGDGEGGERKSPARARTVREVLETPEGKAELERVAREEADRKALIKAGDDLYDAGVAKYGKAEHDEALGMFRNFGGLRQDLLKAVTKLDNGADVMHHLGSNPELLQRVYEMESVDLAIEVSKLSNKLAEPKAKKLSDAKKPIDPHRPGGGEAKVDLNDKDVPMDKWVAEREADLQKRGVRI